MTTSSSVRHWPKPAKKKRGLPPYLTTRDQRILKYIWLWKIASTASIHEMIGRPRSPYSTYKTLERLEKNGFVECRHNPSERFHVWQLTERAFNELRPELGDLAEEGYLSENHHHDRLVQAFSVGGVGDTSITKGFILYRARDAALWRGKLSYLDTRYERA